MDNISSLQLGQRKIDLSQFHDKITSRRAVLKMRLMKFASRARGPHTRKLTSLIKRHNDLDTRDIVGGRLISNAGGNFMVKAVELESRLAAQKTYTMFRWENSCL